MPSSGCLASIRRATQRGSLHRPQGARSRRPAPVAHHGAERRQQPAARNQRLARARAHQPEAQAGRGPGEPADRQARQSRACRNRRATCSNACAVPCSCRQCLRAGRAGSIEPFAPPARFRRSGCRWPPGSASARVSGGFRARRCASAGAARGRQFCGEWFASRQPNCSSVSTSSGAVLLSSGIEVDGERRRARRACRPCRRRADPCRRRTRCRRRSSRRRRPACGRSCPWRRRPRRAAAPGRRRVDCAAPNGRGLSEPPASADINGTNFDDRASWLSAGCQPLARTTSLPLPIGFSMTAASPVLEPRQHARVAERSPSMRRYFQKWILVKSLNWAAGQRGEERVVEGDFAEHHVARRPSLPRCSRAARRPARRASRLARSGGHVEHVPPPRTYCCRPAGVLGGVSAVTIDQSAGRFFGFHAPAPPRQAGTRCCTLRRGVSRKTRSR